MKEIEILSDLVVVVIFKVLNKNTFNLDKDRV